MNAQRTQRPTKCKEEKKKAKLESVRKQKKKKWKRKQQQKSKHFIMCAGHFIEIRLMEHYFRSNEMCERNECMSMSMCSIQNVFNNLYSIRPPIKIRKKCRNVQLNAAQVAPFSYFVVFFCLFLFPASFRSFEFYHVV